jgi:hypothetical protein
MTDLEAKAARGETAPQARIRERLGFRLVTGGLIGGVVGLALGGVLGLILFERAGAIWTSALAGGLFGCIVGMLILGYSSLESPDPGKEPSDTDRPIVDRPEAVREEQEHPSR